MIGRITLPLLVVACTVFGGAAGAFASSPGAHTHASRDKLIVHITKSSGTVWGTVTISYKSAGKTTTNTCVKATCRWSLAANKRVHLAEQPWASVQWPFKQWTIKIGSTTTTKVAAELNVKLTASKVTVTAVYINTPH
jgi:hypothetical protein